MILAFYSYKGGVGRTSLAIDTAARLALGSADRPPIKVLVWDLDLDAPGVAHFPAVAPLAAQAAAGTWDLLSLLEPDADAGSENSEVSAEEVLDVLKRAIVSDPDLANGRLSFLLPSGAETAPSGIAARDASSVFGAGGPGPSLLVLAADLARRELGFDAIIVDARTGINDLSATATTVLADCAVLVFRLDNQDVSHLSEIVNAIHDAWARAGATPADVPNRLYRVANLVPGGDPDIEEAADARRHELADMRLEPHLELPLRPLALVRESTPSLEGPELDSESQLALEGLADWVYQRRVRQLGREGTPAEETRVERAAGARAHANRMEAQVVDLLTLGGWRVHKPVDGPAAIDLRAEKIGEFRRRQLLLIGLKDTRHGASAIDVERLSELDGVTSEDHGFELMLVARAFGRRAQEAATRRGVLLVTPDELLEEQAPGAPLRQRARELWEGTALEREYVAPSAIPLSPDGRPVGPESALDEYALDWLRRKKHGMLCVLGDFGAGKTTFCQRLAAGLALAGSPNAPLPLFVDLRSAGSTALTLDGLLRHALDQANQSQSRLEPWRYRLREGSLVLFVDGFDELLGYTDPARMEGLLEELQRAAATGRVILTSRSSYFRSDRDAAQKLHRRGKPARQRIATALWNQLQSRDEVTAVEVQPFDDAQIQTYLSRRFGTGRVDDILARLRDLHPVDDLLRRPYLLTLVATSIDQWEARGWPTRLTLTSIYESYVADWLARDEMKNRGLPADPASLAQHLARVLWNRPGAQIGSRALRREAAAWGASWSGRTISPDEEETIEAKVRTALFLVRDERGDYRFAHRSFLEYFVAKDIAETLALGPSLEQAQAALDLARLAPEISTFLSGWPESWSQLPEVCDLVLAAAPTVPRASSNALLLKVWYQKTLQSASTTDAPPAVEVMQAQLSGVDLSGADLAGVSLRGADLSGADLTRADLAGADLSDCALVAAIATAADLTRATLERADLRGADLSDATLAEAKLARADLSGSNLRRVTAPNANLENATLVGTQLSQARLPAVTACAADLSGSVLAAAILDHADLRGAHLDGSDLRFASLRGTNTSGELHANTDGARFTADTLEITGAPVGHFLLPVPQCMCVVPYEGRNLVVVGCADGSVRAWSPETGVLFTAHTRHIGAVRSVAPVHLGETGAGFASVGADGAVVLWAPDENTLHVIPNTGADKAVLCAGTLADGTDVLAIEEATTVLIWDPANARPIITLAEHSPYITAISIVQPGPGQSWLLTAGVDLEIRVWDIDSGDLVAVLAGHEEEIRALCPYTGTNGEPMLASGGDDAIIRLWDLRNMVQHGTLAGHTDWIYALCTVSLRDGRVGLASAGDEHVVRIWDPEKPEAVATLTGHTDWIHGLASLRLADGSQALVSASEDETVRLWDVNGYGDTLTSLNAQAGSLLAVSRVTLPDGGPGLAVVHGDGAVRLWDLAHGGLARIFVGPEPMLAAAEFSLANGAAGVILGDEHTIRIWDTSRRDSSRRVTHGCESLSAVCQARRNEDQASVACAGEDGIVRIVSVATGEQVRAIAAHRGPVLTLCSIPMSDGADLFASAGADRTVLLHDGTGAGEPRALGNHGAPIVALCTLARNGQVLLASGDAAGSINLWSVADGKREATFIHPNGGVTALAALRTADGELVLASTGDDHRILLWDLDEQAARVLRAQTGELEHMCAVPVGEGEEVLAVAGGYGAVRVIDPAGPADLELLGMRNSAHWMAYRDGGVVCRGEVSAWGTEEGLDRLLVVGNRWRSADVLIACAESLELREQPELSFE